MDIDTSELNRLIADLSAGSARVAAKASTVVRKAALDVEAEAQPVRSARRRAGALRVDVPVDPDPHLDGARGTLGRQFGGPAQLAL